MSTSMSEMFRVFGRIGLLSFGGPAAQISLMQTELVDRHRWLTESQFLQALSFCMLLPGPEAMQLATYAGWRLRGVPGGLLAGGLFVGPGALVILALAWVYVAYGDVPLVRPETLQAMVARCRDTLVLLTATLDNPTGYGRIIRNTDGAVQAIVEQKDASPEQLAVREVNTGMMALPAKYLREWLPALSADNAQGEYYLTDIIAMAVAAGVAVDVAQPEALWEVEGVNNRLQLNALERQHQRLIAEQLMADGATLADAQRIDVRGALTIGQDVSIDVNCVFEGEVALGDGVEFVVVAAAAGHRGAQPKGGHRFHLVKNVLHAILLRDAAALAINHVVAIEGRRQPLLVRRLRQQVAGKLLDGEVVVGLVCVQRAHHPIAPRPHIAVGVVLVTVGVGVA